MFCTQCGTKCIDTVPTEPVLEEPIKEKISLKERLGIKKAEKEHQKEINEKNDDAKSNDIVEIAEDNTSTTEKETKSISFIKTQDFYEILHIKKNQPFKFLDGIYKFNQNGYRERLIEKNKWIPVNDEGELLYILNNIEKIEYCEV